MTRWGAASPPDSTTVTMATTPTQSGTYKIVFEDFKATILTDANQVGPFAYTLTPVQFLSVSCAVSSTSASGTYSTGQSINITLTFGESLTLTGGNLSLALNSGATLIVEPFSGNMTSVTYVVGVNDSAADLNLLGFTPVGCAVLKNAAGNVALLVLATSHLAASANIIVNPPPPSTLTSVDINLGAYQRSRLMSLTLNFSTPVNAALLANPASSRSPAPRAR